MTFFDLENDINGILRMDAPLTRGPQMRWQRKQTESCNNSLRNDSILNCSQNTGNTKTPLKMANGMGTALGLRYSGNTSNSPKKTPSKTPNKKGTPGRKNKTPSAADRFIPNRSSTQFDLGHHLLASAQQAAAAEETESMSPSQRDYRKAMSDNLNGDKMESKIISYKTKAPVVPEGYQNNLKVLYSASGKTPGSCRKSTRHIPQVPERILDAPEILDDYYLNLLDWSAHNMLAVCLAGHVYLWNASTGDIQQLLEMENPEDYITSVSWIKEGNYLAVGTSNCDVQLWDVVNQKRLRSMSGHSARVGALSWNNHILSSGSRSGMIHHHDVRQSNHLVGQATGHTQEVCGLRWSPDGRFLASGGNDNLLQVWQEQAGLSYPDSQPLYTFSQHQAAVKALAWCPWQPSLLASGGGTADRHIRFWNCNTGSCVSSVDTKSQVCSLLWSKEYKELISSHGFAHNQLVIWKYPSMTKVSELTGHTARVLHMAMSPDETTVVSAAADETLRLWKCFSVDPEKKKQVKKATITTQPGTFRQSIR